MIDLANLVACSRVMLCMVYGGAYVTAFTSHNSFTEVMEAVKEKLGPYGSHFSVQSVSHVDDDIVDYMKENNGKSKYMFDLGED